MAFTNSKLAAAVYLSPNCTKPRSGEILGVAIHCTAGRADNTAFEIAQQFKDKAKGASCNYCIGGDGSIALVVEEKNRAWCTSSPIDHNLISIEVASDTMGYTVRDAAIQSLIELLTDICRRNGIRELKWKADKSLMWKWEEQNMVVHRWTSAKSCPGDRLYKMHPYIAESVNRKLKEGDKVEKAAEKPVSEWAKEAMVWAVSHGITDGTQPGAQCTREQVVTMLYRLYKTLGKEE